jgi:hypothetical protein
MSSPPAREVSPADTIVEPAFETPTVAAPIPKASARSTRSEKAQLDRPYFPLLLSCSPADFSPSSIYVFAKTPQIKKPDGKPLLRKDIQFALLAYIFHNDKAVFTSSYDAASDKMTFSELYIDSMARSSKCSRVVREKLQMDTDLAISVAMVSLLVNVGKMNTTLTCTVQCSNSF